MLAKTRTKSLRNTLNATGAQVVSKQRVADHGEVLTGPSEVNAMLNLVKQETERIDSKFLEPACGTGNFLTEILERKLRIVKSRYEKNKWDSERYAVLAVSSIYGIDLLPDNVQKCRQRLFDVFERQCQLLYHQEYLRTIKFILSKNIIHGDALTLMTVGENPIHHEAPEDIFKMKFDVIIGNPPYQLGSDGGTRDIPIYNKFVDQAKKLNPRFLSMIIPSRWMATGLGLSEFRRTMLEDRRIRKLVDYERMDEVFPGVDFEGGVCYFLWDRDNEGDCDVTAISGDDVNGPVARNLNEYDIFVRDSRALNILHKVLSAGEKSITEILSVDKEFGWTSNFEGFHEKQRSNDITLHYNRKGRRLTAWIDRKDIGKSSHLIDTLKVMVPAAYGERGTRPATVLGPSFIAASPSVCTQTYLFFYVDSEKKADSLNSYLRTRFFRFLVSLRKITQHATRATYTWVPQQSWDRTWTDEELYRKYKLTKDDISFIESRIRPMETVLSRQDYQSTIVEQPVF